MRYNAGDSVRLYHQTGGFGAAAWTKEAEVEIEQGAVALGSAAALALGVAALAL